MEQIALRRDEFYDTVLRAATQPAAPFALALNASLTFVTATDLRPLLPYTTRPHFVVQGVLQDPDWRRWFENLRPEQVTHADLSPVYAWGHLRIALGRMSGPRARALGFEWAGSMERYAADQEQTRSAAGRYISTVGVPSLTMLGVEARAGKQTFSGGEVHVALDGHSEALTTRVTGDRVASVLELMSVILRSCDEPTEVRFQIKGELAIVEELIASGRCRRWTDVDPSSFFGWFLGYEGESGSAPSNIREEALPEFLAVARQLRPDSFALTLALVREDEFPVVSMTFGIDKKHVGVAVSVRDRLQPQEEAVFRSIRALL